MFAIYRHDKLKSMGQVHASAQHMTRTSHPQCGP